MVVEAGRPGRVHYRFSPLERRGVIAGWRSGQIGVVAAGLIVAVAALRSRPSVIGVVAAVSSVAAGVALAFWPVRGRTGEQWLPLVSRWAITGATGTRRQLASAPGRGHSVVVEPAATGPHRSVRTSVHPPGIGARWRNVFDGIVVETVPFPASGRTGTAGVVLDGPARTATAVLSLQGHSFALLGSDDQDSRIAGWARVLASLAREGSEVHRVQWIESCLPDDGSRVRDHLDSNAALDRTSAAGLSYATLVSEAAPITRRHRVLFAVTVHTVRARRTIRASGGGRTGVGAVLASEVRSLQRALEAADVTVDGVLGPSALAAVVAEATAPVDAMGPAAFGEPDSDTSPGRHWPWPMAVEPQWDAVRTDGTWHAVYWIAEWPRTDVTPDFLGPLLFLPLRRSLSLTMEPVSPTRAARQVAQARTADLADGELRRRGGFLVTARHHRERESVEHRDVELADGHAQFRFTGYVTVTADSDTELTQACGAMEQAAGQSRIELRRLYGEQDAAFASSLPFGRGLS